MSSDVRAELLLVEHELRSAKRALLQLKLRQPQLPVLRGGGDNALDAARPALQRQHPLNEDNLVKSLQRRIRERGARAPKRDHVKAALVLARYHPPSFTPDEAWWSAFGVRDGCTRMNVKDYKQRIIRHFQK